MLRRGPPPQAGSSLIEVLAGLLLLSFGLLSLAALQTRLVAHADASLLRARASRLALDLAERMRANPEGTTAGAYDGTWRADAAADGPDDVCRLPCDPVLLARSDLADGGAAVHRLLPGTVVTVSRGEDGAGVAVIDIHVAWRMPAAIGDAVSGDPVCPPSGGAAAGDADGTVVQCLHLRTGV